jgi:hypothetical protein
MVTQGPRRDAPRRPPLLHTLTYATDAPVDEGDRVWSDKLTPPNIQSFQTDRGHTRPGLPSKAEAILKSRGTSRRIRLSHCSVPRKRKQQPGSRHAKPSTRWQSNPFNRVHRLDYCCGVVCGAGRLTTGGYHVLTHHFYSGCDANCVSLCIECAEAPLEGVRCYF